MGHGSASIVGENRVWRGAGMVCAQPWRLNSSAPNHASSSSSCSTVRLSLLAVYTGPGSAVFRSGGSLLASCVQSCRPVGCCSRQPPAHISHCGLSRGPKAVVELDVSMAPCIFGNCFDALLAPDQLRLRALEYDAPLRSGAGGGSLGNHSVEFVSASSAALGHPPWGHAPRHAASIAQSCLVRFGPRSSGASP